jgi:hypothetical protein
MSFKEAAVFFKEACLTVLSTFHPISFLILPLYHPEELAIIIPLGVRAVIK